MERMRSMFNMPFAALEDGLVQSQDANLLPIDMTSDENNIVVRTSVPGFSEDDVHVDVQGNVLTITAESKSERQDQQANWHIREMRYGKFARSVLLPEAVKVDKADASLENGILTVKLPKQKPSPVSKIAVKARKLLSRGREDNS